LFKKVPSLDLEVALIHVSQHFEPPEVTFNITLDYKLTICWLEAFLIFQVLRKAPITTDCVLVSVFLVFNG
jgi:hypothetical protein